MANIFSSKFVIETADSKANKCYKQVFKNNMGTKEEPVITANPTKLDFTKITFYPDLKKFKMQSMDSDTVSLLTKRAYDLAGVSDSKVKVLLNGRKIEIKNFVDYCDLYLNNVENRELPKIIEKKTDRWEILCSMSDGQF